MSSRSAIWEYYNKIEAEGGVHMASCIKCNKRFRNQKDASTSTLIKHLQFVHPELHANFRQQKDSLQSNTINQSKLRTQTKITEFCRKKWDCNDKRAQELHFAIGEMIALDNQPLSIVDDIGNYFVLIKLDSY